MARGSTVKGRKMINIFDYLEDKIMSKNTFTKYKHISLYVKSLSRQPNAVITQISVVPFTIAEDCFKCTGEPLTFALDWVSQTDRYIGNTSLKSILSNPTEQKELKIKSSLKLESALNTLYFKIRGCKNIKVWTNSQSLDCNILRNAFEQYNIHPPWMPYQEADVKTLKHLLPKAYVKNIQERIAVENCKQTSESKAIEMARFICFIHKFLLEE